MYNYKTSLQIIEKAIKGLSLNHSPNELYDPIKYILSIGGKRIRPCILLMSCNLYQDDITHAINPAIAVEVFHNFTLLHDDIMDKAVLRRNHPTVHLKWDTNTAIISGDAMMIKAYELIATSNKRYLHDLLNEFNRVALEVCEGQQFDMNFEKSLKVSVDEYINMIKLKTSVLIASSFKIGALLGGAKQKDQDLIYDVGVNLGIGFQLQDDLLDSFGDTVTFGKKIGGDIVSNKKTFLLLTALKQAKDDQYKLLKKLLTTYEVSREEKIEKMLSIFNNLNIKEQTENQIQEYFKNALYCLDQVSVSSEKKINLKSFIEKLITRFN